MALLPLLQLTQQTGQVGAVNRGYEVGFTPKVEETNGNPFGDNLTGVNTNLGVGSQISYAQQAGVDRSGITLAFA